DARVVAHARAPFTPSIDRQPSRGLTAEKVATPTSLFSEANELRRTGHDEQATIVYRKLQRLFPDSSQAEQSHAIVGQLMLQHSSAGEALAQFDGYLNHSGPLSEDVLVGRAVSLQRLERHREEQKTWEALLRQFPGSVHAARARARLAALAAIGGGP